MRALEARARLLVALGLLALLTRLGPLDVQDEIGVTVSIELRNCVLCVLSHGEIDESKSARLLRDAVARQVDARGVSESAEEVLQVGLGHVLRQVGHAESVGVVAKGSHGLRLGTQTHVHRHVLGAGRAAVAAGAARARRRPALRALDHNVLTLGALEGPVSSLAAVTADDDAAGSAELGLEGAVVLLLLALLRAEVQVDDFERLVRDVLLGTARKTLAVTELEQK